MEVNGFYPREWFVVPFDHHLDVGSIDEANADGAHRVDRISLLVDANHAHFILGSIARCKRIHERTSYCNNHINEA